MYTWEIVGEVAVSMAFPGEIPVDVWDRYLADVQRYRSRYILALSTGSNSINATQRKAVADVLRKQEILAVVVSDSALTRGIVTAVSWLGAKTKSFNWNQVDQALAELPAKPADAARIRKLAEAFKTKIGA